MLVVKRLLAFLICLALMATVAIVAEANDLSSMTSDQLFALRSELEDIIGMNGFASNIASADFRFFDYNNVEKSAGSSEHNVDLSVLESNDLLTLHKDLNLAIWESDDWKEVIVPAGVWVVGEDIPAGTWTIRCSSLDNLEFTNIEYGEQLSKSGKKILTEGKYIPSMKIWNSSIVSPGEKEETYTTLDLTNGFYLIIDSAPASFTTYTGSESVDVNTTITSIDAPTTETPMESNNQEQQSSVVSDDFAGYTTEELVATCAAISQEMQTRNSIKAFDVPIGTWTVGKHLHPGIYSIASASNGSYFKFDVSGKKYGGNEEASFWGTDIVSHIALDENDVISISEGSAAFSAGKVFPDYSEANTNYSILTVEEFSSENLCELYYRLVEELAEKKTGKICLQSGAWVVGEDVPAGIYDITVKANSKNSQFLLRIFNSKEDQYYPLWVSGDTQDQVAMKELKKGNIIVLAGSMELVPSSSNIFFGEAEQSEQVVTTSEHQPLPEDLNGYTTEELVATCAAISNEIQRRCSIKTFDVPIGTWTVGKHLHPGVYSIASASRGGYYKFNVSGKKYGGNEEASFWGTDIVSHIALDENDVISIEEGSASFSIGKQLPDFPDANLSCAIISVGNYASDELLNLYCRIIQELAENKPGQIHLESGVWIVGEDVPAGTYDITVRKNENDYQFLLRIYNSKDPLWVDGNEQDQIAMKELKKGNIIVLMGNMDLASSSDNVFFGEP